MPNYTAGTEEQRALLDEVLNNSEELEVVHETEPVIAIVSTLYEDGAFDAATKKRLGSNPVITRKVGPLDHCVFCMVSGKKGQEPPDFILHIDPAAMETLPVDARRAFVHNALAQIVCEREESEESGDWEYKRAGDGRYAFKVRPPIAIAPETLERYGAFSSISAAILKAAKGAQMDFNWQAVAPEEDPDPETATTPGPGNPALAPTDGTPEGGAVEQVNPGDEANEALAAAAL